MRQKTRFTRMLARNGWRPSHALSLLLAIAAVIGATWSAWMDIAITVIQQEYARPIVLVIPVMVWLVWVRRARFRFVRPGGTQIGWVILIAGIQFYYMNEIGYGIRSASHVGAVMMLAGAILACTGKSLLKQFGPAWLIFPLLVPVPYTIALLVAQPIQHFEAHAIASLYGVFGVNVEVLTSPVASRMFVGQALLPMDSVCKGLPTIMSLMIISYGFVFGSPMRGSARGVLLLITPLIALFCSALSLGATLWLYDGHSALVTADLIRAMSEWFTLLIAFLLIAGAVRLLSWASLPVHHYHLASSAA